VALRGVRTEDGAAEVCATDQQAGNREVRKRVYEATLAAARKLLLLAPAIYRSGVPYRSLVGHIDQLQVYVSAI